MNDKSSEDRLTAEEPLGQHRGEVPKPQLERFCVACVDMLGYERLIKKAFDSGKGNEELLKLRRAWDQSHSLAFRKYGGSRAGTPSARFFTDNIVIAEPVREHRDDEVALLSLLGDLAYLQWELISQGYFLRGAVAMGEFYMDDEIVFGPTFLEAMRAEKTLANWPRIIMVGEAKSCAEQAIQKEDWPIFPLIRDIDEHLFIDYLEETVFIAYPDDGPFEGIVSEHKAMVESKLSEFRTDSRIWGKYVWAAEYHNSFCERHRQHISDESRIPETLLSRTRRMIHYHREHNEAPSCGY